MATVNLGRIKPIFKGAYAGGTAYVVDDIVTSGNETFICIQAGTGNATSNASYWTKLAAKGTDGTDVGTTLTTQGDILYRDGSGLQRLPKGTAGQVLKMNSGATAPEYGNLASDMVLLNTTTLSGGSVNIDNVFSATYKNYMVYISNAYASSDAVPRFRYRTGGASGSTLSSGVYTYSHWRVEQANGNTGTALTCNSWQDSSAQIHQQQEGNNANKTLNAVIHFFNPYGTNWSFWRTQSIGWDNSGTWVANMTGGGTAVDATAKTGLHIFPSAGTWSGGIVKIYGLK